MQFVREIFGYDPVHWRRVPLINDLKWPRLNAGFNCLERK